MKLIVTGATGFVGTEVIRLALRNKAITSVIAIARKHVPVPEGAGPDTETSKLQSVVLEDWMAPYPESIKEVVKGADACIWTLAVTPTKSKEMDFEEVTKICLDYTMNGLRNLIDGAKEPFRFVYTSGFGAVRDQSRELPFMPEYMKMRGRVETAVLDLVAQHAPTVEVVITKPAGIEGPGHPQIEAVNEMLRPYTDTPYAHVSDISAAMIDQCLNGFAEGPLLNRDMKEIGERVLRKEDYAV